MHPQKNTPMAVAWLALGAVVSLACGSSIVAATALIFLALDVPAPALELVASKPMFVASATGSSDTFDRLTHVPRGGACIVEAWNAGANYCVRDGIEGLPRRPRDGPVVVVQVARTAD